MKYLPNMVNFRAFENNGLCKMWGANKVYYGEFENREFSQKIRKFRFEVKWKGNLPENLFGNCGQPPEVVLFFRSERNLRNALTICRILPFPGPFSQDRVKYARWNAV